MTTVERVVALQRVDLFADVPAGRWRPSHSARPRSRSPRGTLSSPRAPWRTTCTRSSAGECGSITGERAVATLGAGSTVGELAALVPEPRAASVTALEPTTLLRIDRPVLDELLADRPGARSGIIAALVAMVRERARAEADTTTA